MPEQCNYIVKWLPSYLFQQKTLGSLAGKKNRDTATNMAEVESLTKGLNECEGTFKICL